MKRLSKRLMWSVVAFVAAGPGSIPAAELGAADFPPELVDFVPYKVAPLLAGAGEDTWDRNIRERGYILRDGNAWHLFYTGYNEARSDCRYLGYATSSDGLNWKRWPHNPLTTAGWVEDVQVVKHGDTYYMVAEGRGDIAHMLTSQDLLHWKQQGNLDVRCVNGKPLSPGPYGTPVLWVEGDVWNLFYERNDAGVWLARSRDAKVWTNVQDEPVLHPGPEAYDSKMIAMDQVIKYRGHYYAYYHALGQHGWNSCVAMSDDLLHWRKYPHNPIVDGGNRSSPIVVHDGKQYRLYTMHPDVRAYFPRNATKPADKPD